MRKNKHWLSAAALAAATVPAIASVPQTTSPTEFPAVPDVAGSTGLSAADLKVGRDGTVGFDVKALGLKVADGSGGTNKNCAPATNNGC